MAKVKDVMGVLLFLIGIGFCLYPTVRTWTLERQTENTIREFEKRAEIQYTENQEKESIGTAAKEDDSFYQECLNYNQMIYEEGQSGFRNAWSYEQPAVSLDAMDGEIFGYVEIPSMDTTLALYLGASETNLLKGVAAMGQTSIPIGGENTNCVIAGHRGYYGSPYLRDIEKLSSGDMVYVTNPWETLAYRVVSIDIIEPYDTDAVKIQKGRDMVTLLTCHPYAANTVEKVRYAVYCERYHGAETETGKDAADPSGTGSIENGARIVASSGKIYDASDDDICRENMLRKAAAALLTLLAAVTAVRLWRQRKEERRFRENGKRGGAGKQNR